jgi:hypothetical protein
MKKDVKKGRRFGTIEATTVARGPGFIGVQIVNRVCKLTAYNAKKKPVAADFTRVVLRWNVPSQKLPERTQLLPDGGRGLFTPGKMRTHWIRFACRSRFQTGMPTVLRRKLYRSISALRATAGGLTALAGRTTFTALSS